MNFLEGVIFLKGLHFKSTKQILAVLLAAVITFSSGSEVIAASIVDTPKPSTSNEQINAVGESITSGDYVYSILEDGTAEITQYGGNKKDLIIPDELDGKPVTSIGKSAFKANRTVWSKSFLENVTIPSSVTKIGDYAFEYCTTLLSITIPNSVTSIGRFAFQKCSSLEKIEIPNSVTEISEETFINCSNLTNVIIPNSVTSIGRFAFQKCSSLEKIEIPNSVTQIGDGAFADCTSLVTLNIPDSVTSFDSSFAFAGCSSLTSVKLPVTLTTIGSDAFRECSSLKSMKIPDSITYIRDDAFMKCTSLEEVTIPNTVSDIGDNVFSGCISLQTVKNLGIITNFGKHVFDNCDNLTLHCYQNSSAYKYAKDNGINYVLIASNDPNPPDYGDFKYTLNEDGSYKIKAYIGNQETVIIPTEINDKPVVTIGESAFLNAETLKTIDIPSSIKTLEYAAFWSCDSLETVNITGSLTTIGVDAFKDCKLLKNITIPNTVTDIGVNAFAGTPWFENNTDEFLVIGDGILLKYNGLRETVSIPNSVKRIYAYSCSGNEKMKKVIIPNSVSIINENAFSDCSNLVDVTLPNGLKVISDRMFWNCTSLKNIEIPNTVTYIGICAFKSCSSLEKIDIPNSVTSIGADSFGKCQSLKKISIPNSFTTIPLNAFEGCSALTIIELPNSINSLGDYAFNNCSSLKQIVIPASVTNIGYGSFAYCTALKKIYFAGDLPSEIGYSASVYLSENNKTAFKNVVATVYYPKGNTTWANEVDGKWYAGDMTFVPYDGVIPGYEEKTAALLKLDSQSTIKIDEEQKITVTAYDENNNKLTENDVQLTYNLSNTGVASIVEQTNGYIKLKGEKAGETTLTVTDEKSGKSAKQLITIVESADNKKAAKLVPGKNTTVTLNDYQTIYITPYDKDGNKLTMNDVMLRYDFSDKSIVEIIDENYSYIRVKGIKKGTSSVTVTDEYTGTNVTFDITVVDDRPLGINVFGDDTAILYEYKIDEKGVKHCWYETLVVEVEVKNLTEENIYNPYVKIELPDKMSLYNGKQFEKKDLYVLLKPEQKEKVEFEVEIDGNIEVGTHPIKITCGGDYIAEKEYIKSITVPIKELEEWDNRIDWGEPEKVLGIETGGWTGRDNFSFTNSSKYFHNNDKNGNGVVISDYYFDILTNNMEETVRQYLQKQRLHNGSFGGSCYGMSVATSLLKSGYLNPTYWQTSEDYVNYTHDLLSPIESDKVENLISFYYLSQHLPDNKDLERNSIFQYYDTKTQSYRIDDNNWLEQLVSNAEKVKKGGLPICVNFSWLQYVNYESDINLINISEDDLKKLLSSNSWISDDGVNVSFKENDVRILGTNILTVKMDNKEYNITLKNKNAFVIDNINYRRVSGAGHTVLAYDVESNEKLFKAENEQKYFYRVSICDPNENKFTYLYISKDYSDWYYHNMSLTSKDDKTHNVATDSMGIEQKYISYTISDLSHMDIINPETKIDRSVLKNYNTNFITSFKDTTYAISANGKTASVAGLSITGDLKVFGVLESSETVEGVSNNTITYYLQDDNENEYQIDNKFENSNIDYVGVFGDILTAVKCSAASTTIIDPNGKVDFTGNNSDYELQITSNDGIPTSYWHTIVTNGKNANKGSLEITDKGVLLKSDNLEDVTVTAKNDNTEKTITFSTDKESVMMFEQNNAIVAYVDMDNNGTYETPLDSKKIYTLGDVDDDGEITGADSYLILRQSVALESFSDLKKKLADVDGDGVVTSADALEVLRYSVELPSKTDVGKKYTE